MASQRREHVVSKHLGTTLGRQLRQITASWMGRAGERPDDELGIDPAGAHTYSYTANSGEMNHMGHFACETCEGEMHIQTRPDNSLCWQCDHCGRLDDTSFRICSKCQSQVVPDKWAASAPGVPVSLNAGGCTRCERCIVCDGVLALGNLLWFHGRWTHTYPSPEFEHRTGEEITVLRERSKFYGFHAHLSCQQRRPELVAQVIKDRTPEWFKQGEAQQAQADAARLRHEKRCLVCKNPLTLWDKLMERSTHKGCV